MATMHKYEISGDNSLEILAGITAVGSILGAHEEIARAAAQLLEKDREKYSNLAVTPTQTHTTAPAPVVPFTPAAAPVEAPTAGTAPVAPEPAPTAPVGQTAPQSAPTAPSESTVTIYSMDEILRALSDHLSAHPEARAALMDLLPKFGVDSIAKVSPERYNELALALREQGVSL